MARTKLGVLQPHRKGKFHVKHIFLISGRQTGMTVTLVYQFIVALQPNARETATYTRTFRVHLHISSREAQQRRTTFSSLRMPH